MSLRRSAALAMALLFAASSSVVIAARQVDAPNVTGTWTGTFTPVIDGQQRDAESAHMVLKQSGADVTGTAGPSEERQFQIAKGKIATTKEATTLTFEADADGTLVRFELKLVEGRLKGDAKAERDGQKMVAAIDVGRAK